MTGEQLGNMFMAHEYIKVPSNLSEFTFYFHRENQGINAVCTIDFSSGLYVSEDQYFHIKDTIRAFFADKGEQNVHILTLILCKDMDKARLICAQDRFCWLIDVVSDSLIIYEEQVPDFYGLKSLLEDFLLSLRTGNYYQEGDSGEIQQKESPDRREKFRNLPWINLCLVAVNVIVFLICTFTGDLLYNEGAFSVRNLIEEGAFYRMLTSMFLHADIEHLVSNMVVLYYVGEIVEKKIGHLPYLVIYLLSGLAGDVFSMAYELWTGEYVSSVGASGAIFGIEGALLLLVALHHGKLENMTAGRVAFAIAFSLYCGFTSTFINNAAHIGGLMMGMTAMTLLWIINPRIRQGIANK